MIASANGNSVNARAAKDTTNAAMETMNGTPLVPVSFLIGPSRSRTANAAVEKNNTDANP